MLWHLNIYVKYEVKQSLQKRLVKTWAPDDSCGIWADRSNLKDVGDVETSVQYLRSFSLSVNCLYWCLSRSALWLLITLDEGNFLKSEVLLTLCSEKTSLCFLITTVPFKGITQSFFFFFFFLTQRINTVYCGVVCSFLDYNHILRHHIGFMCLPFQSGLANYNRCYRCRYYFVTYKLCSVEKVLLTLQILWTFVLFLL